jgi:hypothetical protein
MKHEDTKICKASRLIRQHGHLCKASRLIRQHGHLYLGQRWWYKLLIIKIWYNIFWIPVKLRKRKRKKMNVQNGYVDPV